MSGVTNNDFKGSSLLIKFLSDPSAQQDTSLRNKVKRLGEDDRKRLLEGLTFLAPSSKDVKPLVEPLTGRVTALLWCNSGKDPAERDFFTSLVHAILNRFWGRVSSESIMKKIKDAQKLLPPIDPKSKPLDLDCESIIGYLASEKKELKSRLKATDSKTQKTQIAAREDLKKECDDLFKLILEKEKSTEGIEKTELSAIVTASYMICAKVNKCGLNKKKELEFIESFARSVEQIRTLQHIIAFNDPSSEKFKSALRSLSQICEKDAICLTKDQQGFLSAISNQELNFHLGFTKDNSSEMVLNILLNRLKSLSDCLSCETKKEKEKVAEMLSDKGLLSKQIKKIVELDVNSAEKKMELKYAGQFAKAKIEELEYNRVLREIEGMKQALSLPEFKTADARVFYINNRYEVSADENNKHNTTHAGENFKAMMESFATEMGKQVSSPFDVATVMSTQVPVPPIFDKSLPPPPPPPPLTLEQILPLRLSDPEQRQLYAYFKEVAISPPRDQETFMVNYLLLLTFNFEYQRDLCITRQEEIKKRIQNSKIKRANALQQIKHQPPMPMNRSWIQQLTTMQGAGIFPSDDDSINWSQRLTTTQGTEDLFSDEDSLSNDDSTTSSNFDSSIIGSSTTTPGLFESNPSQVTSYTLIQLAESFEKSNMRKIENILNTCLDNSHFNTKKTIIYYNFCVLMKRIDQQIGSFVSNINLPNWGQKAFHDLRGEGECFNQELRMTHQAKLNALNTCRAQALRFAAEGTILQGPNDKRILLAERAP